MIKSKFFKLFIVIAALLGILITYSISHIKRNAHAYLYGYPLVLMEQTRLAMSSETSPKQIPNHFTHVQIFPDHSFRNVVRPNNDTLYSVAWLDLGTEPLILSVPNTQGRYYVMPFMDAWTNVFASVGKRTTGTQAGHYALTGPEWSGELPKDVKALPAPTNMVWIIGRIQTNGVADIPRVAAMQKEFTLTPLSQWETGTVNPHFINATVSSKPSQDPNRLIEEMSADVFFNTLATLMGEQSALTEDDKALKTLSDMGIVPGNAFDIKQMNILDRFLLEKSLLITRQKLKEKIEQRNNTENGWVVYRDLIGNYGTHYDIRAAVALIGLGALAPEEAAYPNTILDSEGEILSGKNRYKLHFPAGETPPVKAFWSLSLYDEKGFFVDNPIQRYSIGDRDSLKFNLDGSLDLFIQQTAPNGNTSNWLPSSTGTFSLTLRLYHPKQSFLDGSWPLPTIERIN